VARVTLLRRRIVAALAGGAALLIPACASEPKPVYVGDAARPVLATESFGALVVTLPEPVPVRSVAAAAEAALRDRGYTIMRRRTTDEAAHLVARAPARELGRQWTVEARATGDGRTSLSVDPGGWDNEAGAEVMMDEVLRRLGR
jgi:hypothetical protein